MQNFDSDKAARVWQRVRSEEGALPELATLPTLAAQELELATYYQRLARTELAKQCRRSSTILQGIGTLAGIPCKPVPYAGQMPREALRVCYGKTLQLLHQYEALQTHPEYGCGFRALAENKRTQACFLLEMVGKGS